MFMGEAPSEYGGPQKGGYGYDAPEFGGHSGGYDPPAYGAVPARPPQGGGYEAPAYGAAPVNPPKSKRPNLGAVVDGAKDLFQNAPNLNINEIRNELEGPKPLRVIAALGGLAMTVAATLGLLNLKAALTQPARYVTQVYMALFGVAVVVIEMKSAGDSNSKFNKQFMYKWFPFTSVVGGKGAAYIFFGSLGLSFGLVNSLLFIPGGFMVVMGGIYCLIHFAKCNSLAEKYDKSVYYSQIPAY